MDGIHCHTLLHCVIYGNNCYYFFFFQMRLFATQSEYADRLASAVCLMLLILSRIDMYRFCDISYLSLFTMVFELILKNERPV